MEEELTPAEPKPPPIFIPDVIEIKPLMQIIDSVAQDNYFLKPVSNNQMKVQSNSIEAYRNIVKILQDK